MQGRHVGAREAGPPGCDDDFCRRLLCAVLWQAIKDARRGDAEAATWLAGPGATWAECILDIAPTVWQDWPQGGQTKVHRRVALTDAERACKSYAKKRGRATR